VIGFVEDAQPAKPQTQVVDVQVGSSSAETDEEVSALEGTTPQVEIMVRNPVPVLMPRLDLCDPTGVEWTNRRVMIVGDHGKVGSALAKKLKALGAEGLLTSASELTENAAKWLASGEIIGAFFLPALDTDPDWLETSFEKWAVARKERVETLYELARILPENAFLIGATRMGGYQGVQETENPMGGLVSGFIKALRRERPQQLSKVIDFEGKASPTAIADTLISEALHDPFSVEIGSADGIRYGITLENESAESTELSPLSDGSVIVVSGGTGGITGSILKDLARAGKYSFHLLGRTFLTDKNDADLAKIKSDRNAFRVELQERLARTGERATPLQLDQKIAVIERAAETRSVMEYIEARGGRAAYLQCDVTDQASVSDAIEKISKVETRVDVFLHAAGIDKSKKVTQKPLEEFRQVVSVKAEGFLNIFKALEKFERIPSSVVFFSSVAGRFGNSGQTDYSAANDYLSKLAGWLPKKYPNLHALSIDWGAWAEVGMASRGNIPSLMARAGIEMLDPRSAAPMVRREILRGKSGEVVIAGKLGELESAQGMDCGLNVAMADEALRAGNPIHTMFNHLVSYNINSGITLEAELDPTHLAYLQDHAINGIPVLPGVMGIEGFSVAAKHISSVLASGQLGFEVDHLENIQFLAPFKFYGNKPRSITWKAIAYRKPGDLQVVVTLESDIKRRGGETQHMLHFSGLVHLSPNAPVTAVEVNPPKWMKKKSVSSEEIYKMFFHGRSFQVLDAAQLSSNDLVLGRFNKKVAGISADDPTLFASPLLIELCFQTAGLWEAGSTGVLALPQSIGSLRIYSRPLNGVAIFAEVKHNMIEGKLSFDARVVDEKGNIFLELTDYQTSPLPYPAEKELIEPFKILISEGQR